MRTDCKMKKENQKTSLNDKVNSVPRIKSDFSPERQMQNK